LALARRFCALADREGDPGDCLVGDRMTGASLHFLGEQGQARERIESVLARYIAPVRRSHAVRFQFDQRITARITLARILWLQGFPDRALQDVHSNVEEALSLGHALSLSNSLAQAACPIALLAGDLASARRFSDMLRRNTAEHALDVWRAYANCFDGELLVRGGDHAAGLRLLRPAVDDLRRAGFTQYLTSFLGTLAQALVGAGRTDEALALTEEALARCERTDERWCLAELLRIRAEAVAHGGASDAAGRAEELLREAIQAARSQGALSWELRAVTSLAMILLGEGRPEEGPALLTPVLARFSEGFATTDLQQAARLLRELRHPSRS
jgi:predicted ATPase